MAGRAYFRQSQSPIQPGIYTIYFLPHTKSPGFSKLRQVFSIWFDARPVPRRKVRRAAPRTPPRPFRLHRLCLTATRRVYRVCVLCCLLLLYICNGVEEDGGGWQVSFGVLGLEGCKGGRYYAHHSLFLLLMCACVIDVRIRHWLIPYLTVLCDFFLLVAFGC